MTVGELRAKLKAFDQDLPVILNSRSVEFTVAKDAAVPPNSKDKQFVEFVFIDAKD